MGLLKLLKRFKCKVFACCGSKCSLNDIDGDGIPDTVKMEFDLDEERKEYYKKEKSYNV